VRLLNLDQFWVSLKCVEQSGITRGGDCVLLVTFSSSDAFAALSFRGSKHTNIYTPRADYNSPIRGQWGTKFMPVHNKQREGVKALFACLSLYNMSMLSVHASMRHM
jgi:hypothetical protein